tara:strand:- start:261 stop:992 length:732 start_codon:yes stop_codon:yes gene_type:complete
MPSGPYERFYPGEDRGLLDPTWPGVTERGVQETWGRNLASFNERQREKRREEVQSTEPKGLLDTSDFYAETGLQPESMVGPMAGVISKGIKKLIGQPTTYDQGIIRKLAEKVIRPSGKTDISDEVVFSKKVMNKRKDGTLSPLFHEKDRRFQEGVWHRFEVNLKHPTKVNKKGEARSSANLAYRPGFYGGPKTPQIKMGRVGHQNRVKRDVAFRNWTTIKRPAKQGDEWYLAAEMMIIPRKVK